MKMRLPTRSDMICGYACLKGILRDCECRLYCPRHGFVLFRKGRRSHEVCFCEDCP